MTTRFHAGAATDVGNVREVNQDSYLVAEPLSIFAVADGMGGHAAGEVASAEGVAALSAAHEAGDRTAEALRNSIRWANRSIYEKAATDPEMAGMGCTMTAIALLDDGRRLAVGNVGDSRTYLLRDGGLTQLTSDHSWVQEMVRAGELTPEQAEAHPRRSTLSRALGIAGDVEVDVIEVDPYVGDRYCLCSDGLWDEVPDEAIASVLQRLPDPEGAAQELVRQAKEAGGRDNVTVVVVDVVDDDGVSAAASAELAADYAVPSAAPTVITQVVPPLDVDAPPAPAPLAAPAAPATRLGPVDVPTGKAPLVTWRVGAFVGGLVLIAAVVLLVLRSTGDVGYYVFVRGEQVLISHGRPDAKNGAVPKGNPITTKDLAPQDLAELQRGARAFDTEGAAQAHVFDVLVCNAVAAGRIPLPQAGVGRCTNVPSTTIVVGGTATSTTATTQPTSMGGAGGPVGGDATSTTLEATTSTSTPIPR